MSNNISSTSALVQTYQDSEGKQALAHINPSTVWGFPMTNLRAQIAKTGNCFKTPPTPKKGRKRLPQRSKKRETQEKLYLKLRKEFLGAHPWCQIWLKRHEHKFEDGVVMNGRIWLKGWGGISYRTDVPRSQEIHHSKKPRATYLNDTSTWFACCRQEHEWVENHKDQARALGILL